MNGRYKMRIPRIGMLVTQAMLSKEFLYKIGHTNFVDFAEQYSQSPQNCSLIPLCTVPFQILETNEKLYSLTMFNKVQ